MDLSLKTSRGAVISVHDGSVMTTNLWDDSWYTVTNLTVIEQIRRLMKNPTATDADWLALKAKYTAAEIGTPYRRTTSTPKTSTGTTAKSAMLDDLIDTLTKKDPAPAPKAEPTEPAKPVEPEMPKIDPEVELKNKRTAACQALMNFFSEVKFTPGARFVNSVSHRDFTASKQYVIGYAELTNHSEANVICDKIKSLEFKSIVQDLNAVQTDRVINKRLDIYYGDPGTGKTTLAAQENPDAAIVTCNSNLSPDELMRVFDFNDETGKPVFKPSPLRLAMEEGKVIIFDEINLLNFDCLRFIQELTDNKKIITYQDATIEIKDGFKIIGTMNLTVNDQVYGLPEPLVDRIADVRKFTLSAEQLADYAF